MVTSFGDMVKMNRDDDDEVDELKRKVDRLTET